MAYDLDRRKIDNAIRLFLDTLPKPNAYNESSTPISVAIDQLSEQSLSGLNSRHYADAHIVVSVAYAGIPAPLWLLMHYRFPVQSRNVRNYIVDAPDTIRTEGLSIIARHRQFMALELPDLVRVTIQLHERACDDMLTDGSLRGRRPFIRFLYNELREALRPPPVPDRSWGMLLLALKMSTFVPWRTKVGLWRNALNRFRLDVYAAIDVLLSKLDAKDQQEYMTAAQSSPLFEWVDVDLEVIKSTYTPQMWNEQLTRLANAPEDLIEDSLAQSFLDASAQKQTYVDQITQLRAETAEAQAESTERIKELEAKLATPDAVAALRTELEAEKTTAAALRAELDATRTASFSDEASRKAQDLSELIETGAAALAENQRLRQQQLSKLNEEINQAQQALSELEYEEKALEQRVESSKRARIDEPKLRALEDENADLVQQVEKFTRAGVIADRLGDLEAELAQAKDEKATVDASIADLEQKLAQKRDEFEDAQTRLSNATAEAEELESSNEGKMGLLAKSSAEITELKGLNDRLTTDLTRIQSELKDANKQKDRATSENAALEASIATLRADLAAAAENLTAEKQASSATIGDLETQLSTTKAREATLLGKFQDLSSEADGLRAELTQAGEAHQSYHQQIIAQDKEIQRQRDALEEAATNLETAERNISALRNRNARALGKELYDEVISNYQATKNELDARMASYRADAQAELDAIAQDIQDKTDALRNMPPAAPAAPADALGRLLAKPALAGLTYDDVVNNACLYATVAKINNSLDAAEDNGNRLAFSGGTLRATINNTVYPVYPARR